MHLLYLLPTIYEWIYQVQYGNWKEIEDEHTYKSK